MRVSFDGGRLNKRGHAVALYDYAFHARRRLGVEPVVLHDFAYSVPTAVRLEILGKRRDQRRSAAILDELRRCLLDGGVPPGTPIPVGEIAEMFGVSAMNAAIAEPEVMKQLVGQSFNPIGKGSPEELERFVAAETARFAKVVAQAGVAGSE